MKRIYLFAIVALLAVGAKAQDTIIFRNGDELRVRVTEVSDAQIKYLLWSNQSGPVYTKSVSEIFMIKYNGGHKELYNQQSMQQSINGNRGQLNGNNGQGYLTYSRGNMELNGRKLNALQLRDMLDPADYNTYTSAMKQRRSGQTLTIIGLISTGVGIGFIIPAICVPKLEAMGAIGLLTGTAGMVILPLGIIYNCASNGRLNWVAENYNNGGQLSQGLSIDFGPTLVCAPDAFGSSNYGLGAGIRLNF